MGNPADQRVAIRNDATGELGHGIKGHIPPGFSEVNRAAEGSTETTHNPVEGKGLVHPSGTTPDHETPKRDMQAVRRGVGGSSSRESRNRSTPGVGHDEVDGRKTEGPS